MIGVWIALVGLASAVIGGLLQAATVRTFERVKFIRESKSELYANYFTALGELSFSGADEERHRNALSYMAQLRGRIGILGSPEVIRAVGQVFNHANLAEPDAQEAMGKALSAMRRDLGERHTDVATSDLIQLMFGSRLTRHQSCTVN